MANTVAFSRPPLCLSVTIPENVNSGVFYSPLTGRDEIIDWTDAQILGALDAMRDQWVIHVTYAGLPVDAAKKAAMIPAGWPIWSKFGQTNAARTRYAPHQVGGSGNQGGDFPTTPSTVIATGTGTLMEGLSDRGVTPMIYMETQTLTPAQIMGGTYDTYLDAWAGKAKLFRDWVRQQNSDRRLDDKGNKRSSIVILRLNQEMNADYNSPAWGWQSDYWTTQDYKDVWVYIHDRLRKYGGARNIRMFYCPYIQEGSLGASSFLAYLPPLGKVQYVGFDAYEWNGTGPDPGKGLQGTLQRGLSACAQHAPKKKIIVGETGVWNTGSNQAYREQWIERGLNWATKARGQGLVGINLFNLNTGYIEGKAGDPGHTWRWDQAGVITTFARMIYKPKLQGRYATPDPSATSATYDGPEPEAGAEVISSDDGGMDIAVATYQEGTWTPTLTCATPGDLSVGYATRIGRYTRIGNRILLMVGLSTSAWTHSTATGALRITGLPFVPVAAASEFLAGAVNRYTKASYTQVLPFINPVTGVISFWATGSGQVGASLDAADMPSGTTFGLWVTGHYQV